MFGNGHNSIAQRWKAEDLLLHQSRAANKRLGSGSAGARRFRSLRSRAPKMYNLRADLFERGTETQFYSDRLPYWIFLIVPAQAIATKWLERFKEFPHRARAASFSIDQVVELAEQRSNCGAKINGPHRCGPHVAWLPKPDKSGHWTERVSIRSPHKSASTRVDQCCTCSLNLRVVTAPAQRRCNGFLAVNGENRKRNRWH